MGIAIPHCPRDKQRRDYLANLREDGQHPTFTLLVNDSTLFNDRLVEKVQVVHYRC